MLFDLTAQECRGRRQPSSRVGLFGAHQDFDNGRHELQWIKPSWVSPCRRPTAAPRCSRRYTNGRKRWVNKPHSSGGTLTDDIGDCSIQGVLARNNVFCRPSKIGFISYGSDIGVRHVVENDEVVGHLAFQFPREAAEQSPVTVNDSGHQARSLYDCPASRHSTVARVSGQGFFNTEKA